MFIYILGASIVVMLVSLIGVIFISKRLYNFVEKQLSLFVSFSAGVFLFIVYHLGQETLIHTHTITEALLWIAVGAVGLMMIFRLLPSFHHHHDTTCTTEKPHSFIDARRIMMSDALHNIGDGILIASAFQISVSLGVASTLSVIIHECIQELSEFFVLQQAGLSMKKALKWNFTVSSTILIGALGSYFIMEQFESLMIPLLGISTGAFFMVVIHDLIPESVRVTFSRKTYLASLGAFLLGLCSMGIMSGFFDHEHEIQHQDHVLVVASEENHQN